MQPSASPSKISKRTLLALWLMIGPTGLWIVTFLGYAISNLVFSSAVNTGINNGADLFGSGGIAIVIVNIILFLTGTAAFISWLPGLIIGIVLLSTKPTPPQPPQTPPAA